MFNLSGRKRAAEIAVQLRLLAIAERQLQGRMRAAINRAVKRAQDAYLARGSLDYALRDHAHEVERLLLASYRSVAQRFGARVFDATGKARVAPEYKATDVSNGGAMARNRTERKDTQGAFEIAVADWLSKYTGRKVTAISGTTRNQIISAISEGEAQGLGVDATARLIREKAGGQMSSLRAAIIARTETHAAATFGGDAAVEATGVQGIKREWMSVHDARTRESHAAADGQLVAMDEPFRVGGASLMRPGDPAGPPEEVIMCRCVVGYKVPGFD